MDFSSISVHISTYLQLNLMKMSATWYTNKQNPRNCHFMDFFFFFFQISAHISTYSPVKNIKFIQENCQVS